MISVGLTRRREAGCAATDGVLANRLGALEGPLGELNDGVDLELVVLQPRPTNAAGHRHRTDGRLQLDAGHSRPHALRDVATLFGADLGQQDQELVAAEPHHVIGGPHHLGQRTRNLRQHAVASLVAIIVVDALEVIAIGKDHCQTGGGSPCTLGLARQGLGQAAAIEQTGHRVVLRNGHQLGVGQLQLAVLAPKIGLCTLAMSPSAQHV